MGSFYDKHKSELTPVSSSQDSVWEEVPVSLEEFCNSWVKEPLFPIQQEFGTKMIGAEPSEWATEFKEGQALWGKGSGKDRSSAKILAYVCYKLLCMRDPVSYLSAGGEPPPPGLEDKIEVGNVCINAKLAQGVFFAYFTIILRNTINPKTGVNWFKEKGIDLTKAIQKRQVEFPKNIIAHSLDSEEYTGEGLNLFFVIFDEVGGFLVQRAASLYTALRTTIRSRFPKYGKLLLISYKRSDNDFMMTRFAQAETEPTTFRSGPFATWEVNLKRNKEEFAEDYILDPEGSQRIFECKGTTQEGGFFRYKTRISQVINTSNRQNPIIGERVTAFNLRDLAFKDFFKPEPQTEYFVHIDLAKGQVGGDAAGFAMAHYKRGMTVSLPDDFLLALAKDSNQSIETLRSQQGIAKVGAVVDLILQIKAPSAGEIMFEEIRAFIERLRRVEKFPIFRVTYDGWQSVDSIQQLKKAGVNAEEFSVDRTSVPYTTLKNVIYEGIFETYLHSIFVREAEELIQLPNGKIDHPELSSARYLKEDKINRGSKDVTDAVCGAVAQAMDRGKSLFGFGILPSKREEAKMPHPAQANPARFESQKLVRRGERPNPSGSIGS